MKEMHRGKTRRCDQVIVIVVSERQEKKGEVKKNQ